LRQVIRARTNRDPTMRESGEEVMGARFSWGEGLVSGSVADLGM
jgi:hypothetical protein